MTLKFIAVTIALGTALASTPASAMPTSNLATVAPSMTDNVRYCSYRGCGRVYVRRYAPYYSTYSSPYPYYSGYGPAYSGGYGPYYGGYAYGGPGISLGIGGIGVGIGGWGRRGRW